jgi:RNA polymerase sigma-70 factor (ECF subfamily)
MSMLETDEERKKFSELYNKHKGRCLAAAFAITRNHAWAEEAVHDAFIKMILSKEKFFSKPCKRTGTLIVIIVKSAAIDLLRRERRLDHALLKDDGLDAVDDEPDAFRIAAGKEAVARLQCHVSQLNEVNQALFEMKHMRGMSDGEIAEVTGLSKNAVAVRLHRLKNGLREIMREEGIIDG